VKHRLDHNSKLKQVLSAVDVLDAFWWSFLGLTSMWVFPKIWGPQNGRFIMEIPIKMDDLEVPPFLETPVL